MNGTVKLMVLGVGGLLLMASNRRQFDHIGNFNFRVEIEGVTVGAFRAVHGIDSFTEVIEFKDGDNIIVRKEPGRTLYSNIVLDRGFVNSTDLWNWRRNLVDGRIDRRAGSIILCDDGGDEIMRYNFFEAWPARWSGFELDAQGSKTVVETVELAVEKVERG